MNAIGKPAVARLIFALDERLRRRNGVFDYDADGDCLLRLQLVKARRRIVLRDGVRLQPSDRVLELHFRNEHIPPMGPDGATVAWARKLMKLLDRSFEQLWEFLRSRPDLADVAAIRGVWHLRSLNKLQRIQWAAPRFGFELVPETDTFGRKLMSIGPNAMVLLLVIASNPKAAHLDLLFQKPVVLFLSRRALERRYGHWTEQEENKKALQ